jgi:hypothetical protein
MSDNKCPVHGCAMVPGEYQIESTSAIQGKPGQKFSCLMCPEAGCGMLQSQSLAPESNGYFKRGEDGKPVPWYKPTS